MPVPKKSSRRSLDSKAGVTLTLGKLAGELFGADTSPLPAGMKNVSGDVKALLGEKLRKKHKALAGACALTIDGRVATVTLDRPQARNALSRALMRELTHTARDLAERSDIDVVLLSGAGGVFSAGADLNDANAWADDSLSTIERRAIASTGFKLCKAWEEMPQITIAAIEGYAVGGGLALALACDWRVVAEDAFVSLPEIALGIPLTWGTIPRLVNLLGPAKAKRLTILCERFTAAEALTMGVIDYVAPKGGALAKARAIAAQTLAKPAASVRMSKESVNAAATILNHATSYMAHDQIALAAGSPESRAARAAALKRGK